MSRYRISYGSAEHMFTDQHVHWQPGQQTLGANTAVQEADIM